MAQPLDPPSPAESVPLVERLRDDDPTLRELCGFGGASHDEFVSALAENTTVTSLRLVRCSLDDEGCAGLMQALTARPDTLMTIRLARNRIGAVGAAAIGEFMCSSTRELNGHSKGCSLNGGAGTLRRRAAGGGGGILRLDLLANRVSDEGAVAIANAIRDVASSLPDDSLVDACGLVELGLERNRIGDVGALALSAALRTPGENLCLRVLRLGNNDITSGGVIHGLASALESNTTLEVLSLAGNKNVGDAGAKALGRALRQNRTLRALLLAKCGISVRGSLEFVDALYRAESPSDVLELSNHTLEDLSGIPAATLPLSGGGSEDKMKRKDDGDISLRQILQWNKTCQSTSRRRKLGHFLSSEHGATRVIAASLERKLIPALFYKIWKSGGGDCDFSVDASGNLGALYFYLRGMPYLCENYASCK